MRANCHEPHARMEAVGECATNDYLCAMVALSILDLSPVTTATPPRRR
jgi:hypothetical protein